MKLWIFSDLHIDVGHNDPRVAFRFSEPRPEHDAVVIAGDIREDMVKGVKWIANSGFDKPVVYVGGNHEFYRTKIDRNREKALDEAVKHSNIHVLQDSHVDIDGVRFIGATLWTDYCVYGEPYRELAMRHAGEGMNDHRLIRLAKAGYRKWLPRDCVEEYRESAAYIRHILGEPFDGPKVVVTHHAPSPKSIPQEFAGDLLSCAFASDLEAEVDRADLWVHGHIHTANDYIIGDGRVVCNPRGYAYHNEHTGFNPSLVVDVGESKGEQGEQQEEKAL